MAPFTESSATERNLQADHSPPLPPTNTFQPLHLISYRKGKITKKNTKYFLVKGEIQHPLPLSVLNKIATFLTSIFH